MLPFYAFFAAVLLCIAAAAFLVARCLWSRTRFGAGFSALGILILGAAFFPLPIHGGFTVLGLVFIAEIDRQKHYLTDTLETRKDTAFEERLAQRFSGRLPFVSRETKKSPWQSLDAGNDLQAYLQKDAGLIWTAPLLWEKSPLQPDLGSARNFCRNLSPQNYWDLPTEAELYRFWAANGAEVSPGSGHSSLAVLVNHDLQLETLTRYAGSRAGFALRCVALGPQAPVGGYTQRDIPLEDWNRFQLLKTEIFQTRSE